MFIYLREEKGRKRPTKVIMSVRRGVAVLYVYLYTFYMIFLIKHIWCDYVIYYLSFERPPIKLYVVAFFIGFEVIREHRASLTMY